jgi:hypothetical protein
MSFERLTCIGIISTLVSRIAAGVYTCLLPVRGITPERYNQLLKPVSHTGGHTCLLLGSWSIHLRRTGQIEGPVAITGSSVPRAYAAIPARKVCVHVCVCVCKCVYVQVRVL